MSPPHQTHDGDRFEQITQAAADRARMSPTRSEVHELKVEIALLIQRIDHLIADRDRDHARTETLITSTENRLRALELQGATIKTWGVVGAAVWSLLLTLIGLKLWSPLP